MSKNIEFRKEAGRFPEDFPEEIATSKKRRVPEDFRKVPGRFPGRAKTHKAPPQICCNPDRRAREKQQRGSRKKTPKTSPEIFRKISGRFPEEQPPAATPRSAWRQSDAVNKERANLRPNSLLLWFDFMQNVALRLANLELGDMF